VTDAGFAATYCILPIKIVGIAIDPFAVPANKVSASYKLKF